MRMRVCSECPHYAGYLGWDEDRGDYDLCACCWGDGVAYECAERYGQCDSIDSETRARCEAGLGHTKSHFQGEHVTWLDRDTPTTTT